jgi:hypothetical protein
VSSEQGQGNNKQILAYFEISNQNHHCQTGYNYFILTQIIDNLLEINTKRLTWLITTMWGMNNTEIILRGYFTTQNTWIDDIKYTSDKNRVS